MLKTHLPITPNHHLLNFSTPTDTLHIHYKAKLASLHSTCMAMLPVNGWILHPIFYLLFLSAFVVSRIMCSLGIVPSPLALHTVSSFYVVPGSSYAYWQLGPQTALVQSCLAGF